MQQTKSNHYDAHIILQALKSDVTKDKWVVVGMILFFISLSCIIFPLVCFYLLMLLAGGRSYWIIQHASTLSVLLPYVFVLIFYIYAVNDYITNKQHHYYQKVIIFFVISLLCSIIPLFIVHFFILWAILFFLSAMLCLYYLSLAFLQTTEENFIPLSNDHLIDTRKFPYSLHPLNLQDEFALGRFAVATASGGFMIGNIFAFSMIKSCLYLVAIARQKNMMDAAMFLDETFENHMQPPQRSLNTHAKTILLYKNYFIATPHGLDITAKTKEVALKAKKVRSN